MPLSQPDGYLALPAAGTGKPVLVLHAWWGLNDTIKAICNRLAEAGFMAFALDLYHGQIARTIPEAQVLGDAIDTNHVQTEAEIAAAAQFLYERAGQPSGGVAVLSFSLGTYYALELADADPERVRAIVVFYGTGGNSFAHARAAYLGHFAEHDPYVSAAHVDELEAGLKQAGLPVTFYRYPGTKHWFFEPDRTVEYDPAAASLAWERTLAFLNNPPGA